MTPRTTDQGVTVTKADGAALTPAGSAELLMGLWPVASGAAPIASED